MDFNRQSEFSSEMDFYRHAVEVLETLVKNMNKRGRYQNSRLRLRRSYRFRDYRAIQRINRERGRTKKLC